MTIHSLYFHFPFCETKCHYCDFYSIGREKTKESDAGAFERAIIQEIKLRSESGLLSKNNKIKTIFLGGGTPSMTPPDSMNRIFDELKKHIILDQDYEWTMEANPSSISLEQFQEYRKIGINRVSMGVQSLKNEHLVKLGRVHNEGEALKALSTLFEAGFTNVSTDLLCGVPAQTTADLKSHLDQLTHYPITHLSIYLLTLTSHHKMFKDLPNEDEQLNHLLFIDEYMKNKGFLHYEISNFCKPGFQAKHNLVYWKHGQYLSFGPSAHSYLIDPLTVKPTRFKNYSSLHQYARTLNDEKILPIEQVESLSLEQLELEKWMLAIRLSDGFPTSWLKTDVQIKKSELLIKESLLEIHPDKANYLRATTRGFAMSDGLVKSLIN